MHFIATAASLFGYGCGFCFPAKIALLRFLRVFAVQ